MTLPDRTWQAEGYRYGFNGKEADDEVFGGGNGIDYGFRCYDARIGRFLSVDPLASDYPWYTPYQFAGNKPIWAIDLDGLEEYVYQYTLVGKKATLLRKIKNSEVRISISGSKRYSPVVHSTLIDKRTGEVFPESEKGKVQYQYFDVDENRLDRRRDIYGDYVEGENEIMDLGDDNYFGSIYIGHINPTVIVAGEEKPDYRREPQDEMDAAALRHDQAYDDAQARGAGDAFFNRAVRPADVDLVNSANQTKQKATSGGIDNVTGQPVTSETARRARWVSWGFTKILNGPKPETPRPQVNTPDNPGRYKYYEPKW